MQTLTSHAGGKELVRRTFDEVVTRTNPGAANELAADTVGQRTGLGAGVMTRTRRLLAVVTASLLWSVVAGAPALAAEHCAGKRAGCAATLQDALDAAQDGDTIRLIAGTFAGGATVTKSVTLAGAGQHATIVKGGGPVLTIGTLFDETPPVVSIRDLTITGGRTTSSPQSLERTGKEGVMALGGGIQIPPAHAFAPGATVSIVRTNITGNRVAPVATVPGTPPCPGGQKCPFALAAGGGIDNWGTLTVTDSSISDNRIGSASGISTPASDAEGAGVRSQIGSLTILRSRIHDNLATAAAPNGRFADTGGVFAFDAPFTMRDCSVTGNRAELAAGLPDGVEQAALAGGIHLADSVPTGEITRSIIANNGATVTNTTGDAVALSGGLHVDLPIDFTISDSLVSDNRVSAATLGSSLGLAHADGGGGQLFGRMNGTRVIDNTVTASSVGGDAEAMAGGSWVLFGDVRGSTLGANQLRATAPNGEARARGGGAVVDAAPELPEQGGLSLTNTAVRANTASVAGASNLAQGGGLYDAALPDGPFGGPLALANSSVTHNALRGPAGATLQGGGIYLADQPLTQTNSLIARNTPDQCFGCAPTGRPAIRTARSSIDGAPTRHR